ncbi:MAG: hypothetical protein ACJ74O_11020, partial [Frankiaceae bacterium]
MGVDEGTAQPDGQVRARPPPPTRSTLVACDPATSTWTFTVRGAAVLRCCGAAVLRCCGAAVLRCCGAAVLRCCGAAVLRCCGAAVLR